MPPVIDRLSSCRRYASIPWRVAAACGVAVVLGIVPRGAVGAQSSDQNPPDVRWRVVESPRARVIATPDLEGEAQRVAGILERIAALDTLTLGGVPRRLEVVLQPRLLVSNGFVSYFPRRSEWFLQTPQGDGLLGGNDWYDLLAVHEYRHVKQLDALDAGLTRRLSRILGETPRATLQVWSIPPWLMEGDAVATETALTDGGRGRMPSFDADLRARLLEAPVPSYQTLQHGSLGTYWPNHYVHGYALVAEARRRFGAAVWDSAMRATTRRPWNPWTLSGSLSRQTGLGLSGLHRDALERVQAGVRAQAASLSPTPAVVAGREPREWQDDQWPQWTPDGALIVTREGIDVLRTFVSLTPGAPTERVLQAPGPPIAVPPHSVGGATLAWPEARFDPRWGRQSWGVVMRRDLRTGEVRQLGDTTRWTAVAVAPDGGRLAVIEQRLDRRSALVFLEADGVVARVVEAPAGDALVTPRWSRDGGGVLLVRVRRGAGRRIEWCPASAGACRPLMAFTPHPVHAPAGDTVRVFAGAPQDGREEIVALEPATGRWRRVTERPIGASDPSPSLDGTRLAFNDWTPRGRRAVVMPLDTAAWRPYALPAGDSRLVALLTAQAGGARPLADTTRPTYPVRDYDPVRHLWRPYGAAFTSLAPTIGLSVLSQDVLGTLATQLGASYNTNEGRAGAEAAVTWAGRYPIVDLDVGVRGREDAYPAAGTLKAGTWSWRETSVGLGIRLPLNVTDDLYQRRVLLFASVRETRVSNSTLPSVFESDNGTVRPVTVGASFQRSYATLRDIWPVWGQGVSASATSTPIGGTERGHRWFARGRFFAPGPVRHHGVQLDLGWESQARRASLADPAPYRFASLLPFARGYAPVSAPGYQRVSASYAAPLWYPDWGLWQTLQVRRVRMTAFGDWMEAGGRVRVAATGPALRDATFRYRSVGLEVLADTRWWNLPLDIPVGARWSWRFDGDRPRTGQLEAVVALEF